MSHVQRTQIHEIWAAIQPRLDGEAWIWGLSLVVLVPLVAGLLTLSNRPGELPVYEKAAVRLIAGESPYQPRDPPAFTYPPFFALPAIPLLGLPIAWRPFAWNLMNAALLWGILRAIWDMAGPWLASHRPPVARFVGFCLVVGLLGARFLVSPLEYRAHDYWVLLGVLLSARCAGRDRDAWAGVWGGLAAACKATPLLLVAMFLWQRRWLAAATFLVTGAAACMLPDLLFPAESGVPWVQTWHQTFSANVRLGEPPDGHGAWIRWNPLNQSLVGTLYRLSAPVEDRGYQWDASLWHWTPEQLRFAVIATDLLLVLVLAWGTFSRPPRGDPDYKRRFATLGQFALVLCCMLLMSPMSSKQHFCALFPAIAVSTASLFWGRRRVAIGGCLAVVALLGPLGAKDIIGGFLHTQYLVHGSLTAATAACLLATLWAMRSNGRPRGARAIGSSSFKKEKQNGRHRTTSQQSASAA